MLLVLVSCASGGNYVAEPEYVSSYKIKVDSITGPTMSPKKFKIIPGKITSNDLRFKELASIAAEALKLDGFVQDNKSPEINITLVYSVGRPQVHSDVYSTPTYGTVNSQVINNWGQNVGSVSSHGQTGTRTNSDTYTTFERKVVLKAFSAKTKEELWETTITSKGSSDDLRELFPYLVFAGVKFYGKSQKESVIIKDKDPRAEALRAPASN